MSDINFRIVTINHEPKFNNFKKDFDTGCTKKELMEKYDIPKSVWVEWRDRIFEDNPKHFRRHRRGRLPEPKKVRVHRDGMVQRTVRGNYTVYRNVKGQKVSYGTYPNRVIAENVYNELIEHKWNPYVARDLLEEHGIPVSKKVLLSKIIERKI